MDYVIGFDLNRNMLRLLSPGSATNLEELPIHKALVARGDYAGMLKFALRERNLGGAAVRVALPDTAMACDFFTVPALKSVTKNAMKVEFENIYTNHKQLKYNTTEFNAGKRYVTNQYVIVRQSLLDSVAEGVKAVGGSLKGVTSAPNGVCNAFFSLGGKLANVNGMASGSDAKGGLSLFKKKSDSEADSSGGRDPVANSVLFVDIQRYMTRMVLASKQQTMSSLFQPYGYGMLYPNKVVQEYMLTNHDVAELAVLNAIETAKRKKQTVAIASDLTDEEDEADEEYMEMLEALSNKDAAPLPKKKKQEEDDSAEYFDDPDQKQEAASLPTEPKPFDKIAKKVEKKYPKFMLRERPTDADGFVMENFRSIQKYILLFLQGMENSPLFAKPEKVILNLPPEFGFIPTRLNEEVDNGVEFVLLENGAGVDATALDNLDLYGASLMDKYNKAHNF